jgi:hypothetical protein
MNPRELVDHIRSGAEKLVLDEPLRFRRRSRTSPCDFNELLQALQTSETIRTVTCKSQLRVGITEDDWALLVKTIGSIKGIEDIRLHCLHGSRNFHPFQAVAEALNNAQSLCKLVISPDDTSFPRDPAGLIALADALREHTSLQEFGWIDHCSRMEIAQIPAVDPVLWALPGCPHLRKLVIMTNCASTDARKNLLQLHSATELRLVLETDHWLAVVADIRQGRCNVQRLTLAMFQGTRSEATEAVQALASAIQLDGHLEHLALDMENLLTDEAGVALAEALTVNVTLRTITLAEATLGAQVYEAFSKMLRVNTNLVLKHPPFETAGADERLRESHKQLVIEQRLNEVGRGRLLASRQATREEWVYALHELNSYNVDDSHAFQVSCLYSLLHLNPSVICMSYSS